MNLVEKIRELSAEVKRKQKAAKRSEANTSRYLVEPFFQTLGYDPTEPEDVEPEFTADVGIQREKVDYALKADGKPIILIEVKVATANLSDGYASQLRRYFSTKLDVRFGILTNGLEFHFYSDLDKPNVMDDNPFLTIDMRAVDDEEAREIGIFSKSVFDVDRAMSAARMLKYRGRIKRVLNEMFDPLSDELVELIVRKAYAGRFTKAIRDEFTPLVLETWSEFLNTNTSSTADVSKTTPILTSKGIAQPLSKCSETTSAEDEVEVSVFGNYKGRQLEATLLLRESIKTRQKIIRYKRQRMDSVRRCSHCDSINQSTYN